MKKHALALLLATAIVAPAATAFGHDHDDDKDKDKDKPKKTDAAEMSIIGLAVASALGAGTYLVYRRRVRTRG
jgi:hypothetical protein